MRSKSFAALVAMLISFCTFADMQSWTDMKGRTVKASLIGISEDGDYAIFSKASAPKAAIAFPVKGLAPQDRMRIDADGLPHYRKKEGKWVNVQDSDGLSQTAILKAKTSGSDWQMPAPKDISPVVTRIPNGVFEVTNRLDIVVKNPPVSDFLAIIGYPEPCQYYDIKWVKPPPRQLVKTYKESGDRYIRFSSTGLRDNPKLEWIFRIRFYSVMVDFSKIDKIYPYDKRSRLYRDNTRIKEAKENLKIKEFKEVVTRLEGEAGGDPLKYARLAYAYVANNFTAGDIPNGPEPMLERAFRSKKSGDCGPVHNIFIQLCRAGGVPARVLCCLRPCLSEGRHHVTSEIYLEKWGWMPVDFFGARTDAGGCPENGSFGKYSDHTVAMTRGTVFQTRSDGGQRPVAVFNQGINYWYWNWNGYCGEPYVTHLFDGVRLSDDSQ